MERTERMERMERVKRAEKVERTERMKSRVHGKGFTGRSAGAFSRGVLPLARGRQTGQLPLLSRFDLSEDKHNNADQSLQLAPKPRAIWVKSPAEAGAHENCIFLRMASPETE